MNPTDSFLNVGSKNLSDNNNDLWRFLKGVLKACDEVCAYKKYRKCNVNMWWRNSEAKDEIQKRKNIKK